MKYQKKPFPVEAVRWFKVGDHPQVRAARPSDTTLAPSVAATVGIIDTEEGPHIVYPGVWVAGPGEGGEFWPIREDIFEASYELIPE